MRDQHPRLALDRLDQECTGIWCDGGLESFRVAEGNRAESRSEWAEPLPAPRVRRETDDRSGATVEVILADQNLRPVWSDALAVVGPLAGRFDGSLDGFRPRVHGQHHLHPAQFRQFPTEQRQLIIAISPRREGDPLGLLPECPQDAWMAVALVDRRVGAQAIQVASAIYIKDPRPFSASYHHGQRMVIVCAPLVFERKHVLGEASYGKASQGTKTPEPSAYHRAQITPLRARK